MGKLGRIALLVAALLGLALIAVALGKTAPDEPGLPTGPQAALDAYVLFYNATAGEKVKVVAVRQAPRPDRLGPDALSLSLGDSVYYGTDVHYYQPEETRVLSTTMEAGGGARRLPYPPEQVWCAFVAPLVGDGRGVVLLALHQDIYNADWVTHQALDGPFSPQAMELAASVGCE